MTSARLKPEARNSIWASNTCSTGRVVEPSSVAFPDTSAGSGIRRSTVDTQIQEASVTSGLTHCTPMQAPPQTCSSSLTYMQRNTDECKRSSTTCDNEDEGRGYYANKTIQKPKIKFYMWNLNKVKFVKAESKTMVAKGCEGCWSNEFSGSGCPAWGQWVILHCVPEIG